MSRGCHKLIRDGATLVETVDDVLDQLGPLIEPLKLGKSEAAGEQTTVRHPAELKLSEQERNVLNCIETAPTEFDVIVEKTQLPPARILATISVLEIRRLIRRISSTSFVRL
jgi:DNA processing protein